MTIHETEHTRLDEGAVRWRIRLDIEQMQLDKAIFVLICSDMTKITSDIRIRERTASSVRRSVIADADTDAGIHLKFSQCEAQRKFDYVRNSIWRSARVSHAPVTCLINLPRIYYCEQPRSRGRSMPVFRNSSVHRINRIKNIIHL